MKLCQDYLRARGITDETVKLHGLQLDDRLDGLPADIVKERLGRSLPKSVNEVIWFPIWNDTGNIVSWIARILPEIANLGKFLCPVGSDGGPYVPRSVYNLAHGKPIILTEGPIKALACVQAGFDAIGINGVWGSGLKNSGGLYVISAQLQKAVDWRGRKVYLGFDADQTIKPDVRQALFRLFFILSASGAEIFQFSTWDLAEGKGIDDYLVNKASSNGQHKPQKVLKDLLSGARPFIESVQSTPLDLALVCSELRKVQIPDILRSQLCKQLAGPLGVRVSDLEEKIALGAELPPNKKGRLEETIDPWPEPVEGGQLLQEIFGQLQRFVIVDENGYTVICLHVVLAYCWELFFKLPILRLKSPVKRCGKSTVLDVIERLVIRPLLTVSLSPAGLYRIIEAYHPYAMIDEADSFGEENDELRIIVNGGFERGRPAIRVNKETLEPEFFDTFGCKVLASIGPLHETIEDRSIIIDMKRKAPGVEVEELCDVDQEQFFDLRRKIWRWVLDNRDQIQTIKLSRPKALVDRVWNKWRPLLSIAHIIGGIWPAQCLKAAHAISVASDEERSIAFEVLIRIRTLFGERLVAFLPSDELVEYLNCDKEAPWADWKKGDNKGITVEKLSRILKTFKIKSHKVQIDNKRCHGYRLEDFKETFESYLPPEESNNDQGTRT